uniref:Uncharacterized protein n=1 Tax=Arundo donax TaxID=35708 RepID=A0A0A9I0K2_ARUDO
MFESSIEVRLGNGMLALFWTDKWLEGQSIQLLALDLFQAITNRAARRHTVCQVLQDRQWIRDITGP